MRSNTILARVFDKDHRSAVQDFGEIARAFRAAPSDLDQMAPS
ncbi:hypothetical protein [Mesorhizobium sp.]|nr:hypothetical protein [Mesorhizobium sp.]